MDQNVISKKANVKSTWDSILQTAETQFSLQLYLYSMYIKGDRG